MPSLELKIGRAFLFGIRGLSPDYDDLSLDHAVVSTDEAQGAIEQTFQAIGFTPSLADPETAYEAGRCLRMIGYILDRSGVSLYDAIGLLHRIKGSPSRALGMEQSSAALHWDKKSICSILKDVRGIPADRISAIEASALSYSKDRPQSRMSALSIWSYIFGRERHSLF